MDSAMIRMRAEALLAEIEQYDLPSRPRHLVVWSKETEALMRGNGKSAKAIQALREWHTKGLRPTTVAALSARESVLETLEC